MSSRRLALGSILQVANLLSAAAASLLIMPFVVRTVGDAAYGVWVVVGTFVGYYGLLDFGMTATVTRYLAAAMGARDGRALQQTFATALAMFAGMAVVVLLVTAGLIAAIPAPAGTDPAVFRRVLALAGLAFAVGFPTRAFAGLAQAALRYDIPAGLELLGLAVRTTAIVLLLHSGWSIDGLAIASLAAALLQLSLYPLLVRRLRTGVRFLSPDATRATMRRLADFSAFVFLAQLADVLRFRLDVIVVGHFVGLAAVTHYGIAATLINYFISLLTNAAGVLGGVFSRQAGADELAALRRSFLAGTRLSTFLASFAGFGLVAWGRAFITRWMGPAYTDAYPSLALLAVGCTIALWQVPSVPAMYGIGRHRFFAYATIAEGAANLVLSIVLASHFGMFGVALGTFIPMVVIKLFVQPVYVCRSLQLPLGTYAATLGTAVGQAALALAPGALLAAVALRPTIPSLLGVGAATAAAYALALWFFGFQTWERGLVLSVVARRPATT